MRWSLGGEHNRMNALAALAAADHAGVPAAQGIEALSRFGGVKRRMELRGTVQGVKVYDDFAHHPTAIATTIAGLRRQVGRPASWPCWSPLQHHETRHHGRPPARCAGWRRPVFCFGAKSGKHALGWDPAEVLAPLGARASHRDDIDALVDAVVQAARPGDHVLVMSNGGFGGIHGKLLERWRADDAMSRSILCLHGARPTSFKARLGSTRPNGPGRAWACPQLPASPRQAIDLAMDIARRQAGRRGGPGCPTRRPCAGHEQRRLRRHPRQAAGCAGATRLTRKDDAMSRSILYLHGFRSSPTSFKARLMADAMAERGLAGAWACPHPPARARPSTWPWISPAASWKARPIRAR